MNCIEIIKEGKEIAERLIKNLSEHDKQMQDETFHRNKMRKWTPEQDKVVRLLKRTVEQASYLPNLEVLDKGSPEFALKLLGQEAQRILKEAGVE